MKTNEAPEKIYIDSKAIGDNISTTVRTLPQDYPTCTEYIRADAFIEKAVEYIITHIPDMHTLGVSAKMDDCIIKDFRKYMKGE